MNKSIDTPSGPRVFDATSIDTLISQFIVPLVALKLARHL